MIYLASPYTHPDIHIRIYRYQRMLQIVADETKRGELVYSPIVHYHQVALNHDLPTDFEFWRDLNFQMIALCTRLKVVRLPGWKESKGVREEEAYAISIYKPVSHIHV